MWMVEPNLLCRKHLLGEHSEIHKHKHNFEKGHSFKGRVQPVVQIEPLSMQQRHDELVKEMIKRGYNHKSPYTQPSLHKYTPEQISVKVDKQNSIKDLLTRCQECKILIEGKTNGTIQ
jgi:hypothetical protein